MSVPSPLLAKAEECLRIAWELWPKGGHRLIEDRAVALMNLPLEDLEKVTRENYRAMVAKAPASVPTHFPKRKKPAKKKRTPPMSAQIAILQSQVERLEAEVKRLGGWTDEDVEAVRAALNTSSEDLPEGYEHLLEFSRARDRKWLEAWNRVQAELSSLRSGMVVATDQVVVTCNTVVTTVCAEDPHKPEDCDCWPGECPCVCHHGRSK